MASELRVSLFTCGSFLKFDIHFLNERERVYVVLYGGEMIKSWAGGTGGLLGTWGSVWWQREWADRRIFGRVKVSFTDLSVPFFTYPMKVIARLFEEGGDRDVLYVIYEESSFLV